MNILVESQIPEPFKSQQDPDYAGLNMNLPFTDDDLWTIATAMFTTCPLRDIAVMMLIERAFASGQCGENGGYTLPYNDGYVGTIFYYS